MTQVSGKVRHGEPSNTASADSNPVPIGGRYRATAALVDDGDADTVLTDGYGRPIIVLTGHNGTDSELLQTNKEVTLLASSARTASTSTANQTNRNHRGIVLFHRVSAAADTSQNLTLSLDYTDPTSGVVENMFVAATVSTTGLYVYSLYPGLDAATSGVNQRANRILPRTFKVTIAPSGTTSFTYSLGACLIV